jgi:hypothetical protein
LSSGALIAQSSSGAMPDQISDIYKAAIKRYEETTDTKLDDPSITTVTTVADLKNTINAKNKEFASFREKRHGLFSALSTAMRPIELFGDLAAKGASMVFPPSTLVFGAISYLVDAANGVSAKYDAIVDLLETLQVGSIEPSTVNGGQILTHDANTPPRISPSDSKSTNKSKYQKSWASNLRMSSQHS